MEGEGDHNEVRTSTAETRGLEVAQLQDIGRPAYVFPPL